MGGWGDGGMGRWGDGEMGNFVYKLSPYFLQSTHFPLSVSIPGVPEI
ncbi:MAG: hypothetical protein F6K58_26005 [Symploca sp. SIO2E9]|nr:hypothetical protein [Symploca sp. SIO2E9]